MNQLTALLEPFSKPLSGFSSRSSLIALVFMLAKWLLGKGMAWLSRATASTT